MKLKVKELFAKLLNTMPQQKFGSSTTSFSAAMPTNATHNSYYIGVALNNLANSIGSYSTGIHRVVSGGPAYGIVLYKLDNSYYCGLVLSYQRDTALVYFKRDQNGYHVVVEGFSILGGGTA